MSDLVGNPEDRFSHVGAQILWQALNVIFFSSVRLHLIVMFSAGDRCEVFLHIVLAPGSNYHVLLQWCLSFCCGFNVSTEDSG